MGAAVAAVQVELAFLRFIFGTMGGGGGGFSVLLTTCIFVFIEISL